MGTVPESLEPRLCNIGRGTLHGRDACNCRADNWQLGPDHLNALLP